MRHEGQRGLAPPRRPAAVGRRRRAGRRRGPVRDREGRQLGELDAVPRQVRRRTKTYPTLEAFQKQTGIKATYAEDIEDNDTYYGKIQAQLKQGQDIGKDMIVLTDWMAGRLVRQGYVQKFDKAAIPNAKNILPTLQNVELRPGPAVHADLAVRVRRHRLQQGRRSTGRSETVDDLWRPDLKGRVEVLVGVARHPRAHHAQPGHRHRQAEFPGAVRQGAGRARDPARRTARSARSRATPTRRT